MRPLYPDTWHSYDWWMLLIIARDVVRNIDILPHDTEGWVAGPIPDSQVRIRRRNDFLPPGATEGFTVRGSTQFYDQNRSVLAISKGEASELLRRRWKDEMDRKYNWPVDTIRSYSHAYDRALHMKLDQQGWPPIAWNMILPYEDKYR